MGQVRHSAAIGVILRGERGACLAHNLTRHGYDIAVCPSPSSGFDMVRTPRLLIVMDTVGPEMDALLGALLPRLDPGDVVVDGAEAEFTDTGRRAAGLRGSGIHYAGLALTGDPATVEAGPSALAGGDPAAWRRLRPVVRAITARFQNVPCAAYAGASSAGHFAHTVHGELARTERRLAAEAFTLLRPGRGDEAAIDLLRGWLAADNLDIPVPHPPPPAAGPPPDPSPAGGPPAAEDVHAAWYASRAVAYSRGFDELRAAGDAYGWGMDRAAVAGAWRAGAGLAGRLLTHAREALTADPQAALLDGLHFAETLRASRPVWARIVGAAEQAGLPVPMTAAALRHVTGPATAGRRPRDGTRLAV